MRPGVNDVTKYVVSDSPTELTWQNSELITGDVVGRVKELKARDGSYKPNAYILVKSPFLINLEFESKKDGNVSQEMVKYTTLSRLLDISQNVIWTWRRAGYIECCISGMYSVASVNEFFRKCAYGFKDAPPTVNDLLSGKLVLLRISEIERQYGFSHEDLYRFRNRDEIQLAYLNFPGKSVRYRESDVRRIYKPPDILFSIKEVEHILGRSGVVVLRLVKSGKLEYVRNPQDPLLTYVSRKSLILLLREWLPEWITPEDWIDDCQHCAEPLIPINVVAGRFGLTLKSALRWLKEQKALFICGSHTKVSPLWLAAYEMRVQSQPLTAEDIAMLYDVEVRTVYRWQQQDLIRCPIAEHHHDTKSFLFQACWTTIIRATCSPGLQVSRFVTARLTRKHTDSLVDISEAARILDCSSAEIERLACSGKLPGIRTPYGRWRVSLKRVNKLL